MQKMSKRLKLEHNVDDNSTAGDLSEVKLQQAIKDWVDNCPGPKAGLTYWDKFLKKHNWCTLSAASVRQKYEAILSKPNQCHLVTHFSREEQVCILEFIAGYKGDYFPGSGSCVWGELLRKQPEMQQRTQLELREYFDSSIKKQDSGVLNAKFGQLVSKEILCKVLKKQRSSHTEAMCTSIGDELIQENDANGISNHGLTVQNPPENLDDLLMENYRSKSEKSTKDSIEVNHSEEETLLSYAELIYKCRRSKNPTIKCISDSAISTIYCLRKYAELLRDDSDVELDPASD